LSRSEPTADARLQEPRQLMRDRLPGRTARPRRARGLDGGAARVRRKVRFSVLDMCLAVGRWCSAAAVLGGARGWLGPAEMAGLAGVRAAVCSAWWCHRWCSAVAVPGGAHSWPGRAAMAGLLGVRAAVCCAWWCHRWCSAAAVPGGAHSWPGQEGMAGLLGVRAACGVLRAVVPRAAFVGWICVAVVGGVLWVGVSRSATRGFRREHVSATAVIL
jgi:hypothetical protein